MRFASHIRNRPVVSRAVIVRRKRRNVSRGERRGASIVRAVVPAIADVHPLPAVITPTRVVVGACGEQSDAEPGGYWPTPAAAPAVSVPVRISPPRRRTDHPTCRQDDRPGGRRKSRSRHRDGRRKPRHARDPRLRHGSPHQPCRHGSLRQPCRHGSRDQPCRHGSRHQPCRHGSLRHRGNRHRPAERTLPQSLRMTTAPLRRLTVGTSSWCLLSYYRSPLLADFAISGILRHTKYDIGGKRPGGTGEALWRGRASTTFPTFSTPLGALGRKLAHMRHLSVRAATARCTGSPSARSSPLRNAIVQSQ